MPVSIHDNGGRGGERYATGVFWKTPCVPGRLAVVRAASAASVARPETGHANAARARFFFRKGAATVQQQNRNMATLKQISMRLKSVTNIQKITQSMKMVSAAKYARAERELRQARPYGDGVKVNRLWRL